jgi:hypothetical protein
MTEHDLKKQSQFAKGATDVKSSVTGDYSDFSGLGLRKNRASQSQSQNRNHQTECGPLYCVLRPLATAPACQRQGCFLCQK